MRSNIKKTIFLLLIIIWMATVFYLSGEISDVSSNTSGNTIRAILSGMPWLYQSPEEKEALVEILQPIARKIAHFSLYMVGGILIGLWIQEHSLSEERKIMLSIIIGFLHSVSDEIHQFFVPGRAGLVIDVMIDTLGIAVGVIFIFMIIKIKNRKKGVI